MPDTVHVAVAVILNSKNEVCISLRNKNVHQGELWEFPGGKVEKGETVEQALNREIREELDLTIISSRPLITIPHQYPDKKVCLHVRQVLAYKGNATGVEGQQIKWLPVDSLLTDEFPAANSAIIKAVQLPEKYLITGKFVDQKDFLEKLSKAINGGIQLVQLRLKEGDLEADKIPELVQIISSLCAQAEVKLLFNIPEKSLQTLDLSKLYFSGYHADSKKLKAIVKRPAGKIFSASCHTKEEILKAEKLDADFIVLSPVQKTASHPEMPAMGWETFSSMLETTVIPVYALGGVSQDDIKTSWAFGAQGVAAISAFWN